MAKPERSLQRWIAPALVAGLFSPSLSARPNGYAAECGGCHYGQLEGGGVAPAPNVTAVAATSRVEPGQTLDITVSVQNAWPDALVAGFLVITEANAGVFTPSDEGTGNVGITDGQTLAYAVGHTAARALVGGAATFQTTWTAPMTVGAYAFEVFGVTSDDGDGVDDPDVAEESNEPFGRFEFAVGVGCDLIAYFSDADLDGYGSDELLACEAPVGYVLQGGDCRDDDAAVNPGAEEQCSFIDENCDGDAMAPPTFFRDIDGDGYGDAGDILVDGCTPPAGYAAKSGDCTPNDATVYPTATEVRGNGVDDNCDGMTDEGGSESVDTTNPPLPSAGVPSNAAEPTSAPTTTIAVAPSATTSEADPLSPAPSGSDAGCSASGLRTTSNATVTLAVLGIVLFRRRSRAPLHLTARVAWDRVFGILTHRNAPRHGR